MDTEHRRAQLLDLLLSGPTSGKFWIQQAFVERAEDLAEVLSLAALAELIRTYLAPNSPAPVFVVASKRRIVDRCILFLKRLR